MPYSDYISFIPLLPLTGFLLLGMFGKPLKKMAGIIATGILVICAILSIYTAYQYFFANGMVDAVYPTIQPVKYHWLRFNEKLSIDLGILLDPASVMMLVVVTIVSLMVHIFSISYMHGEERYSTYFAFLQLFTFSMLGLVVSVNIFQIYIFWELVGVSSFLLIGYYYDKPSAVAASKKAFIVTRFADLGFLIGILILGLTAHTFDFHSMIRVLSSPERGAALGGYFLGISVITWGLVLVFIGGMGKSAMFPLHIWLPDAMEGPTPVSALIHAATMVVAGVYLVARLFPIFALTGSGALEIVAWVGAFSALFAAVIACTQTDIKRVLAYSTMSQIGYMIFALGVSAHDNNAGYTASLFHLFTHAFFKSLLFLCAGVVIHAVHSNDMKDMGGLRAYLPIAHISFLIACLAIAGVPPFAGFFSKEGILHAAYETHPAIYIIGVFTSGLTAFYMFRLYYSIFWSKPEAHLHDFHGEGNGFIKFPLIFLGICTLLAGFVPFGKYVSANGSQIPMHLDITFSIIPVAVALIGIALATYLYKRANDRPRSIAQAFGGLYKAAYKKFYIDEIYLFVTKKIIFQLIGKPAAWFDRNIVDGSMRGIASGTEEAASLIKGLQSGKVQGYALWFFGGVIGLIILMLFIIT